MDLDPLDIRILKALQEDARLSFRELSRQTRASVPTVSAHVGHGLQVLVACFECGKTIEGAPVMRRLDRREHYFCCRTCEAQFVDRYLRLKAAA